MEIFADLCSSPTSPTAFTQRRTEGEGVTALHDGSTMFTALGGASQQAGQSDEGHRQLPQQRAIQRPWTSGEGSVVRAFVRNDRLSSWDRIGGIVRQTLDKPHSASSLTDLDAPSRLPRKERARIRRASPRTAGSEALWPVCDRPRPGSTRSRLAHAVDGRRRKLLLHKCDTDRPSKHCPTGQG